MNFERRLRNLPDFPCKLAFYVSQGFGDREIAKRCGVTYQAVRSELWRMRNRLGFDGTRISLALAIRKAIA